MYSSTILSIEYLNMEIHCDIDIGAWVNCTAILTSELDRKISEPV